MESFYVYRRELESKVYAEEEPEVAKEYFEEPGKAEEYAAKRVGERYIATTPAEFPPHLKTFAELRDWEKYIDAQDLRSIYKQYEKSRQLWKVVQGPLAMRWLRWQVEALEQSLLDLEEELEGNPLSHTPPLTQTRSHDREALSGEPEEALEYSGPATTQGGGTRANSPQYFEEEEPSDDEGWTGPMTKKTVDTTPGEAVEYSDKEDRRTPTPDHVAEEAEDHWWSPDYGWPAEA